MGVRFRLGVLEGNVNKFFHEEKDLIDRTRCEWEPEIEIRLTKDEIIIEPQDQRSKSRYPDYIVGLLKRAYEKLFHFSFRRDEGYYPNPQLSELFFSQVLVKDAIKRSRENKHFIPGEHWYGTKFLRQFEEHPLSDETLEKMFEEGLRIMYSERLKTLEGTCSPPTSSSPVIITVGCDGTKEEQDSTLVHEIVEAYGFFVGGGGSIAVPCYRSYTTFQDYHWLVEALETELYEFGFHQTIKKMIKT